MNLPSVVHRLSLSALCVLVVCGCNKPDTQNQAIRQASKDFLLGKLPLLPGPFLKVGDATKLKFRVIDLGIVTSAQMSEDGDVLYEWYGDHPTETKRKDADGFDRIVLGMSATGTWKLRKRDGTISELPMVNKAIFENGGKKVFLTPGGKLVLRRDLLDPKNRNPIEVLVDGKSVHIADRNEMIQDLPESRLAFAFSSANEEGFFGDQQNNKVSYASLDWKYHELPQPDSQYLTFGQASTKLGVFCSQRDQKNPKGPNLSSLKNGQFQKYVVPACHQLSSTQACKDTVYIGAGSIGNQSVPYKLSNGTFVRQPIIADSYNATVTAAGSVDRCLLGTTFLSKSNLEDTAFSLISESYYVDHDEAFALKDILLQLGLPPKPRMSGANLETKMSYFGDLIISVPQEGLHHMMFLERLP